MLQELSDESKQMCLKATIAKKKVMVVDLNQINVNNVMIENCEGFVYFGQHYSLKEKELQRRIMIGWAAYLKKQACHLAEETCVHLLGAASCDIYMVQTWTLTKQAQNNLLPHKPK